MKFATTKGFLNRSLVMVERDIKLHCGNDDVLVEVHASSVNPKDWKLNTNFSSLVPHVAGRAPNIIGDDLAGVVLQCGKNVTAFAVGDEVYGMDMNWRTAACAEQTIISQRMIAHKPSNLSFSEAGAVPLAALTALQAFRMGNTKAGSKVLVIGASGGVGTFAVQIAKALGATVTGVCSGKNESLVTGLGADAVIDYTVGNYRDGTDDFDVIFDATSYETPQSCASLLKADGIFVSTGGQATAYTGWATAKLLPRQRRAKIVMVKSNTADLDTLRQLIEADEVKVVVDSEFSLRDIEQAYERSKSGRARGKIVVNVR